MIVDTDGEWGLEGAAGPAGAVTVHDGRFWRMLATAGSVGAGEAFVAGSWDSPDLVAVVRVLAANRNVLDRMEQGSARLYGALLKGLHRLARNSLRGSRRNIAAHYDLGNAFFQCWLDPRMQYSSALFRNAGESLEQAQLNKLERIAERPGLGADDWMGRHFFTGGREWLVGHFLFEKPVEGA